MKDTNAHNQITEPEGCIKTLKGEMPLLSLKRQAILKRNMSNLNLKRNVNRIINGNDDVAVDLRVLKTVRLENLVPLAELADEKGITCHVVVPKRTANKAKRLRISSKKLLIYTSLKDLKNRVVAFL